MKKHLKYIRKIFHLSLMEDMEYRTNFFVWIFVDGLWAVQDVIFFNALIATTKTLGNWTQPQGLIVIGLFRLMVIPVWGWMFRNFSKIPKYISQGKLDMLLTKPMDSQFLVSFTTFALTTILSNFILGSLFIYTGIKALPYPIMPLNYLIFAWSIIPMFILIYGAYFLTVAASLYFDRLNNIHHIFPSFFDATRYPQEIYNLVMQRIFVSIIPIAIMIVVPAQTLFGEIDVAQLVWLHILAIIFFIAGRFVWQKGLRHYSSASS